jgi:hypothetical protein
LPERNVDSRHKTQLNGADAPAFFCPETQSWCVIERTAKHFVWAIAEMRDHTQENQKNNAKKVLSKSISS